MRILQNFITKYAASRRGEFISQTTTCEIDGQKVFRHIPEARIPVFPVLSFSSLFSFFDERPVTVLDHGYAQIPVIAARYAIAHALLDMKISPGDEILLPAYHCTVMVAPIVELGATPVFYKIKPNLETDIEDVSHKITKNTKAIIAVNYCGFIQNMAEVRDLSTNESILLIEDCAHSFFGEKDNITVGGYGDYILVSARKFFPVDEGGLLLIKDPSHNLPIQQKQPLISSLKSFLALLERSLKFGKLWMLAPFVEFFNYFRKKMKHRDAVDEQTSPSVNEGDYIIDDFTLSVGGENSYDPSSMVKKASLINSFLPRWLNSTKITQRRREYYSWLSNQFKDIKHCRLLVDSLPKGTVPFMIPIYIDNLDKYFPAFEDAAIPMQRFAQFLWPDVNEETCAITADYSKNVVLFPCHQELSKNDIKWLEKTVRTILEQD